MSTHICFVAGVSGGHILPALTLALREQRECTSSRITFFSTNSSLDNSLLADVKYIEHFPLQLGPLPRNFIARVRWLLGAVSITAMLLWWLIKNRPQKIVSTGGVISLPVCFAAILARIPFDLYELNAVPGRAVMFLAPYARSLFATMPAAQAALQKYSCTLTPYPLRYSVHDKLSNGEARAMLGLDADTFTILVVGGSQGSHFINEMLKDYSSRCQKSEKLRVQIIHQTGQRDVAVLKEWYAMQGINALVFSYRSDVAVCYSAADCVVSRAGAGTLFELQFFEKASMVIPLETDHNDHQVDNAYAMASTSPDLFFVVRQQELVQKAVIFDEYIMRLATEKACLLKRCN